MIVKYTQNDEFTKKFSQICDGRLIWGGRNREKFKKIFNKGKKY